MKKNFQLVVSNAYYKTSTPGYIYVYIYIYIYIIIIYLIDSISDAVGPLIPQIEGTYKPIIKGKMVILPHYEFKAESTVLAWEFYALALGTIQFVVNIIDCHTDHVLENKCRGLPFNNISVFLTNHSQTIINKYTMIFYFYHGAEKSTLELSTILTSNCHIYI